MRFNLDIVTPKNRQAQVAFDRVLKMMREYRTFVPSDLISNQRMISVGTTELAQSKGTALSCYYTLAYSLCCSYLTTLFNIL